MCRNGRHALTPQASKHAAWDKALQTKEKCYQALRRDKPRLTLLSSECYGIDMFQMASILLLIVSLLGCPLRFLSAIVPNENGTDAAQGCTCCSQHQSETESQSDQPFSPAPHEQNCAGDSCFCRGALPGSSHSQLIAALDTEASAFQDRLPVTPSTTRLTPGLEGSQITENHSSCKCGWKICLELGSLLI